MEDTGTSHKKKNAQEIEQFEEDADVPARETWSSNIDFILCCIGFAVGLGNVWRFPYLCYKNGGGAFLIPYFVFLVAGGVPIFFMEIALGQFMSQGGLHAWKIVPVFQGIGFASTVMVFLTCIYYIIILAWDLYYCAMTFQKVLPWSHCNNEWNTPSCVESFRELNCTGLNGTEEEACMYKRGLNATERVDPVVEFWEKKILQISTGVDDVGGVVWELAASLGIMWVLCYFCVWKGVRWTGKVVYFTATFPYVILTALLIRGVTLEGASDGILFYLKPDFARLADAQVWIDGGTQIFFSYAIAIGAMISLGSYNKLKYNCYRDMIIIACGNSFTSLYAGFAVFSVLGFMAHEQQVDIKDVVDSGPGLAFIAYPKAVAQMPIPQLWAFLFFFMIILIGFDSEFVQIEAFVTVVVDQFPALRKGYRREIFIAFFCLLCFCIGLTMITNGGMYVFQLFDYYSASGGALLWVCFFECVAIAWVYGGSRFYDNIEMMIGFRINYWFYICWTVITPIITCGLFIFMWVEFTPLTYGDYEYPLWAQGLGMCLAFASMICIPLVFIIQILRAKGDLKQRWKTVTTPIYSKKVQAIFAKGHSDGSVDNPGYVADSNKF